MLIGTRVPNGIVYFLIEMISFRWKYPLKTLNNFLMEHMYLLYELEIYQRNGVQVNYQCSKSVK